MLQFNAFENENGCYCTHTCTQTYTVVGTAYYLHASAHNPTPRMMLHVQHTTCTMHAYIQPCHNKQNLTDLSARTILVFVTFSMVNLVFPPVPATRPIARDKWSPFSGFTERNMVYSQMNNHYCTCLMVIGAAAGQYTATGSLCSWYTAHKSW